MEVGLDENKGVASLEAESEENGAFELTLLCFASDL
jgi:hypothetical protein